jgi:hypothetical protein
MAAALAACNALLGLDAYDNVACAFDCGADAGEGGGLPVTDAQEEPDGAAPGDGGGEATSDTGPDVVGDVVVPEAGWPVPTLHETWAHWPMPNPDAATGPDAATLLPNQMTYDAGPDGSAVAYDAVTQLRWSRLPDTASSYDEAWTACLQNHEGAGWRVPTRIELVSLVDFTQPSGKAMIRPDVFPAVQPVPTWTSSAFAGDDGPYGYWAVDFGTGLTGSAGATTTQVLCINGATP